MNRLIPELTPEIVEGLIKEHGLTASGVFGKESGDRVKFSKAINDPEKREKAYSEAETAYILDKMGLDPLQAMPLFKDDFFDLNREYQPPKIRVPRRKLHPRDVLNLLRAGKAPRNVTARYIPAKDEHKENMLEATRIMIKSQSAGERDSFENMQFEFDLQRSLEGCTVDIGEWNALSEFEYREAGNGGPPPEYFEVFDPVYGPENAFREGIQIYATVFYYVSIRVNVFDLSLFYSTSKWRCGFDIEFDTAFTLDRSWRENSRDIEIFLLDEDSGEPSDFAIKDEYEADARERLIESFCDGRPDKTRYGFGAPELFQHGLNKTEHYESEGN